ncbi:MAG: hypothetical protein FVQ81_03970 [Candidatus Glassbacteria bacterium]|nr:hypothetical protein [Candidatus Glassbacteria bacterium]
MAEPMNRRNFMSKAFRISSAAAGLSLEEKILLANMNEKPSPKGVGQEHGGLKRGKIGKVEISRLICGGNLFDGFAHSRKLTYVSSLMKHYFNPEKIMDTLEICESNGVNTAIMLCWDHSIDVLNRYRKERGGKIQWIAQSFDQIGQLECVKMAVDNGASGFFVQGANGDTFVREGRIDYIAEILSLAKANGLIAGVGSHTLNVPKTLEKEGLEFDFYFKTINNVDYWSESPEEVAAFMKTADKPWIAFKVLGAGLIKPREGFELAYRMGADFLNVGMFDFQVSEDVEVASEILTRDLQRERPWKS